MTLKEINIQNFKSFENTKTPFPGKISTLSLINLIFGHNSSGKSNILKFLQLLFSNKVVRESIHVEGEENSRVRSEIGPFWNGSILNEPYIFHKNKREIPISFDVSIEILKTELETSGLTNHKLIIDTYFKRNKSVVVKIEGHIIDSGDFITSTIRLSKVSLDDKIIYSDDGETKAYFNGTKGLEGDRPTFEDFMGVFNNLVFFLDKDRYLVTEREDSKVKTLTPNNFKKWVYNLSLDSIKYSRYENFVAFVKKYGSEIEVLKNFAPTFSKSDDGILDILISNGSERLPIGSFGTGIQQFLLILSMIFDTDSKIILIEELELNLSPISQQILLKVFANLIKDGKINQVIFTSHSKTLADTPDIRVYEVVMSKTGISTVQNMEGVKSKFFSRDTKIDDQMKSVLRIPGIPGPEWE